MCAYMGRSTKTRGTFAFRYKLSHDYFTHPYFILLGPPPYVLFLSQTPPSHLIFNFDFHSACLQISNEILSDSVRRVAPFRVEVFYTGENPINIYGTYTQSIHQNVQETILLRVYYIVSVANFSLIYCTKLFDNTYITE